MTRYLLTSMVVMRTLCAITSEEIDQLVHQMQHEWGIPGVSIAMIHKGEEIKVSGYGVKKRGTEDLVDADTLFPVNSLTKAFLALSINRLVQDNRLGWDDLVNIYLPDFQLKDKEMSSQVSLRDMLSHQMGSYAWRLHYKTERSLKEIMHRFASVELLYPFRSQYKYESLGYAFAGAVVEQIVNLKWSEYCKQTILDPLKMKRSLFSSQKALEDTNVAFAHFPKKEALLHWQDWEKNHMEPSAGIISCARDMALWLRYCLSSPTLFGEAWSPQIDVLPQGQFDDQYALLFPIFSHGSPMLKYGFGWFIYNLEGRPVYRHTGVSIGMMSVLAVIPDEELGIVILSNQSGQPAIWALMNQLIDRILNRPEGHWNTQARTACLNIQIQQEAWEKEQESVRNQESAPTWGLDVYEGLYTHEGYGDVSILNLDGKLSLKFLFSNEQGILEHWDGNRFKLDQEHICYPFRNPCLCEFILSKEGTIMGLQIPQLGFFQLYTSSKNTLNLTNASPPISK